MECPSIPKMGYAQFGERLNRQVMTERLPISGSIELTFRCNLRCVHCYCNLPQNDPEAIETELDTDEVYRLLDQIANAGCLWLLITGGEPLLRKDFLDIYTYAKKKGFITTLFTNGTLLNKELADTLAEWPPFLVEITLYGATKKTYENITGVPGSFERCQRGIDLLLERNIPLGLKTMAMTVNRVEIGRMQAYADDLGAPFRFDPLVNPRLDGSERPCRFRLSPEEVVDLDLNDPKRVKAWQELYDRSEGLFLDDRLFTCGAGISMFHIDPIGRLSVCEMSRFESYDLRQGSFEEGWSDFVPQVLDLKAGGDYKCSQCKYIALCAQCPGWAWVETGHPGGLVEHLCRVAHLLGDAIDTNVSRKGVQ
jgi:radical SAM protein with 4Fe4S-binding SPASM domain